MKWQTKSGDVMIPKNEVAASSLLIRGEDIAEIDEYWDFKDMSAVKVRL